MDSANQVDSFPSNNSLAPFWRTQLHELDEHRSAKQLPQTSDILIIGAGYAGIATVYHLLCNEDTAVTPKPSIVVLETRQACSGATGGNGGHFRPAVYFRISKWIKRYGVEAAEEIAKFEFDHLDAVAALMRSFDIYTEPDIAAAAKADHLKLKKAGIAKTTIVDIVFTDGERAEKVGILPLKSESINQSQISGAKGCISCIETSAGQLWTYKLMLGLLSRAVAEGLNLQTNTLCTSLRASANSLGNWIAETSRGSITASKVIVTIN